ncbi:MAG: hypothetical protein ABWY78_00140, partial [Microvirga sp.]
NGRGRGRGADDGTRAQARADDGVRTRTQDQTRTRAADRLSEIRDVRGRGALTLTDDNGGRLARDRRLEPGDDRRANGR